MTTIYKDAGRVQKVEEIGGGSSYDETSDATKSLNVDASGTVISGANPLPVTAVVTGDINIDNNAIGSMLIGKSGGGDFTTAYASSTTITIGTMPYTHTFIADDILSVQQIAINGNVTNTFTRDDVAMTFTTATLTIVGAAFETTDTFVIYTNISKIPINAADTTRTTDTLVTTIQEVDSTGKVSPAGELISNAPYSNANIQNPVWAHVLDEKLLNAVTATGRSTFTDVLSYKGLTFCIVASSITDGATFIFEGSPDTDTANVQGLQAKRSDTGAIGNSFNITADGTYYFQIDDTITPKYLDINLSVRIDGTYTAYLAGRAL